MFAIPRWNEIELPFFCLKCFYFNSGSISRRRDNNTTECTALDAARMDNGSKCLYECPLYNYELVSSGLGGPDKYKCLIFMARMIF